jgi:hypothetical protein
MREDLLVTVELLTTEDKIHITLAPVSRAVEEVGIQIETSNESTSEPLVLRVKPTVLEVQPVLKKQPQKSAQKIIMMHYNTYQKYRIPGVSVEFDESNIYLLQVTFLDLANTPYEGSDPILLIEMK